MENSKRECSDRWSERCKRRKSSLCFCSTYTEKLCGFQRPSYLCSLCKRWNCCKSNNGSELQHEQPSESRYTPAAGSRTGQPDLVWPRRIGQLQWQKDRIRCRCVEQHRRWTVYQLCLRSGNRQQDRRQMDGSDRCRRWRTAGWCTGSPAGDECTELHTGSTGSSRTSIPDRTHR